MRSDLSGWRIVHQTGSSDYEKVKAEYVRLGIIAEVSAFIGDLGSLYPQTTLAISRAGGTTLAELAIHSIPSLLIPYPGSIRDHQSLNAEHYKRAGGAIVLQQSTDPLVTAKQLGDYLIQLLTQPHLCDRMATGMSSLAYPEAARDVADLVLQHCPALHRVA